MIIYSITNTVTGKRYIGMTESSLVRRWYSHTAALRDGVETALYAAMRKYGTEKFKIEQIASAMPEAGRNDLCELERAVIAQEGVIAPGGYNLTAGGDGWPKGKPSPLRGTKMSDEARAKMAAAARRPDRIEALRRRNMTMNQSDEHKAKLKSAWARSPERHVRAADTMRRVMKEHQANV